MVVGVTERPDTSILDSLGSSESGAERVVDLNLRDCDAIDVRVR